MKTLRSAVRSLLIASVAFTAANIASAETVGTVSHAVNFFQNAQATKGAAFTVDAKDAIEISDAVELPGFAFHVYDIDFTSSSLTMTLVAQLEKLQITLYDDTTFDRYYYAFDQPIDSAEIADTTDANFKASVEILKPGTSVSSAGAFVDGLPTEFTFEHGGILITIGEGTDLTKISENGGSLTVNY